MSTEMAPRIVFTGGSGKAGRHAIPELIRRGYDVLNIDLIDFPDKDANVFTLKTDLTDSKSALNNYRIAPRLSGDAFNRRAMFQCLDDAFQLLWIRRPP